MDKNYPSIVTHIKQFLYNFNKKLKQKSKIQENWKKMQAIKILPV